jgi:hypothetical protein
MGYVPSMVSLLALPHNMNGYHFHVYWYVKWVSLPLLLPRRWRTQTRTNTNPNDTEANAAGRSVRACVARESFVFPSRWRLIFAGAITGKEAR